MTVNALFTPDDWQTVYSQPAFYYQEFDYALKGGQDWLNPTNDFSWKVRFSNLSLLPVRHGLTGCTQIHRTVLNVVLIHRSR